MDSDVNKIGDILYKEMDEMGKRGIWERKGGYDRYGKKKIIIIINRNMEEGIILSRRDDDNGGNRNVYGKIGRRERMVWI